MDRQDGVRVADWLRANFATGHGEDWGCAFLARLFLAFLASWLLAQWLLASASTFSQAAEPLAVQVAQSCWGHLLDPQLVQLPGSFMGVMGLATGNPASVRQLRCPPQGAHHPWHVDSAGVECGR
jgi:hypothetical protein